MTESTGIVGCRLRRTAARKGSPDAYTSDVRSKLADSLREERRREEAALSPLERLRLAQRLGDDAVRQYASAHGLDLRAAARELARHRQLGRRPSACLALE